MYQFLYQISLLAFFLLPPVLLLCRWFRPRYMPWWLLTLSMAAIGWLCVNSAIYFHHVYLDDLLHQYTDNAENPPTGLIERWSTDGGAKTFAWLFGWLYGLIYLLPWIVLYSISQHLRHNTARTTNP